MRNFRIEWLVILLPRVWYCISILDFCDSNRRWQEVDFTGQKVLYCQTVLLLVLIAFVVHSMIFTKDQCVSSPLTFQLAVDEREREGFNAGRRGSGHTMTLKQQNKGRNSCENNEWGTALGAHLKRSNKESHVCNKDAIDWPLSQPNRDQVTTN